MQTYLFIFIISIFYSYFIESLVTYLLYKNGRDFFQNTTQPTFDGPPPLPPGIEPEKINNNYNVPPYPLPPVPSPKEKIKFYIKMAIGTISIFYFGKIQNDIRSNGFALGGVFIILSTYFTDYYRFSPLEQLFVTALSLGVILYKVVYI